MRVSGYEIGLGIVLSDEISSPAEVGQLVVRITVELRQGRYVCASFEARPAAGHLEGGVTGEALREVALGTLVENAARDPDAEEALRTTGRRILDEVGGRLTSDSLEVVAAAYRYGYAVCDSPTREVVNLLGLSRSKASRWIAEARDEGLLGAATERRPGALLAIEAARDRVRLLGVQLAVAETTLAHARDVSATAEADAAGSVGVDGRQFRIARAAKEDLADVLHRVGSLQYALNEAREHLARLEAQQKEN